MWPAALQRVKPVSFHTASMFSNVPIKYYHCTFKSCLLADKRYSVSPGFLFLWYGDTDHLFQCLGLLNALLPQCVGWKGFCGHLALCFIELGARQIWVQCPSPAWTVAWLWASCFCSLRLRILIWVRSCLPQKAVTETSVSLMCPQGTQWIFERRFWGAARRPPSALCWCKWASLSSKLPVPGGRQAEVEQMQTDSSSSPGSDDLWEFHRSHIWWHSEFLPLWFRASSKEDKPLSPVTSKNLREPWAERASAWGLLDPGWALAG